MKTLPFIIGGVSSVAVAWKLLSKKTPTKTSPVLYGINTHLSTPADLTAIRALNMSYLRTTDYGDTASAERITTLRATGAEVLVVIKTDIPPITDTQIVWQYKNEPDMDGIAPDQYGADFRAFYATQKALYPTQRIITAGFSNTASVAYITQALKAGAGDADAIGFHAYGTPMSLAITNAVLKLQSALQAANCSKPLWLTEYGSNLADLNAQADDIKSGLIMISTQPIVRSYLYAVYSPDDGYGITDGDARVERPAFARVVV